MTPTSFIVQSAPDLLVSEFLAGKSYSQLGVLTDVNTAKYCYGLIKDVLPKHHLIEVKAGEEQKNLDTCQLVWQRLTDLQFDRNALLLVLGGGVLGDLGGFCAATFKRGIDFVLMPTTLLAQVDASIGGKLGVDFNHLKNHIGLFQNPACTLISPAFLKTLPERELRSGFAEVIKHCLIADQDMWDVIKSHPLSGQRWDELIVHSAEIKTRVISEDPTEKGIRKSLNFGHTVGHAVESYFLAQGERIFHGEAVAIGMITESFIGKQKGLINDSQLEEITKYVMMVYGKVSHMPKLSQILGLIYQDKKNQGNTILMALTRGIGQSVWGVEVREEEIEASLSYYESL